MRINMTVTTNLREVQTTRYITPLREGGSLPAIVEADDGFLYVLKFRGAGQGVKALIADLIGTETARVLGLKVPELVLAHLDEAFGRTEPDEEIQDLLKKSKGINLGVHYLSGSISFDPSVDKLDPMLASSVVWLDALLTNIDRTVKNTNMLMWNRELWLIDFGASLYFHHSWDNWEQHAMQPFANISSHVLLAQAGKLEEVDKAFSKILKPGVINDIISLIPDNWLVDNGSPREMRQVYNEFLNQRIALSHVFLNEAQNARTALI
ncbi:MAG TPA: HipA family kinase [Chitinophagaceae bacterium]